MYFHVLCGCVICLMMTLDTHDFTVLIQRYSLIGPPNWVINLIKSRSSRIFQNRTSGLLEATQFKLAQLN